MEFAVKVRGLDDAESNKAHWVLAVDTVSERFLIVHEDRSLHWHDMVDCTFAKIASPDQPRPVIPVQPQQEVVVPNRRLWRQ